ncbi:2970_t:CDS:2 [Ambispora leptoticha]|uniref:2970_t:CDS:1 n=1 Tax=Ambispora leptoticha TaxID=144679 RepID=A0A9N9FJJ5_9GLOM|nr:2970_t:CDS:2 [Ambispora leptoticha]
MSESYLSVELTILFKIPPLITDVLKIVEGTVNLYQIAEHNKRVCGVLLDRMIAAEAAVKNLKICKNEYREFFKNFNNFRTFQKFKNTIERTKRFILEVSQMKGLRKFTTGVSQINQIKRKFKELTLEFDGRMAQLHFTITIDARSQQQKDHEVIEQGIEDLKNASREENNEGKVQKRRRKSDNKDVAFKVMALAEEPESNIQVTILKKLCESPNIIQFYGLANEGTKKYLVTEWVQYGNLREFYTQHPNLFDWKRKIEFALDICRGLSYLQAVDIIHHNIRSENIFICDGFKAKIGNFLPRGFSDAAIIMTDNIRQKHYYDSKSAEAKIPHEVIPYDIVEICQAVHDEPIMRASITDLFKTLYPIWLKTQTSPSPKIRRANVESHQTQQDDDHQDEDEPKFPEELVIVTPKIPLSDAIKEHRKKNKQLAWTTFNEYKAIGDPLGKYWVGYYLYYNILEWSEAETSKEQRLREAANLFKQAANDCEIPEAELRYGYCLWNGDGVEKDVSHALNYFIRSADHGNVIALGIHTIMD